MCDQEVLTVLSRTLDALFHEAATSDRWLRSRQKATLCLLDLVGVVYAAHAVGTPAWRTGEPLATAPATAIGENGAASATDAAFANAFRGHALDFDDCHKDVPGHASITVIPAALAAGEAADRSYGDLIRAVVWGVEFACQIGVAAGRAQYDTGWHPTATFGSIAAAVAATQMRLDEASPAQLADAASLGALQSSGLLSGFGSWGKAWQVACAARNGVAAAEAVASGVRDLGDQITGGRAYLATTIGLADAPHDGLGDELAIERTLFKPYASCFGTHAVIDATRDLVHTGVQLADIAAIKVGIGAEFRDVIVNPAPNDLLGAKFSASAVTAYTIVAGPPTDPGFFDSAAYDRAAYDDLERRVSVFVDPAVRAGGATVTALLRDGTSRTRAREETRPSAASAEQEIVREKFRTLAGPVIGERAAAAVEEAVLGSSDTVPLTEITSLFPPIP